jgi:hypothetical protein
LEEEGRDFDGYNFESVPLMILKLWEDLGYELTSLY